MEFHNQLFRRPYNLLRDIDLLIQLNSDIVLLCHRARRLADTCNIEARLSIIMREVVGIECGIYAARKSRN